MEINKKILASVFMIGLLAFGLGWGTYSFFSDTETSTGNVFTAGTIDITVTGDGYEWSTGATLVDMKPCDTKVFTFEIDNVGGNPVHVWKRITNIVCGQGVQTEPEIAEETASEVRCWLPPYILYDMRIPGVKWIIHPDKQIRVDNINGFWIYLGEIPGYDTMTVEQSYHLSSWKDAAELEVTNWAQGDTMTFDIELYAEQVGGDGPAVEMLLLENKNPTTWEVISDSKYGELTYGTGFTFKGYGLVAGTQYSLIYYKDKWPGSGSVLLASGTGTYFMGGMSGTLPTIPQPDDLNYPVGGKIWLVLSSDYDDANNKMTAWNPTEYLFDMHLINVP